MKQDCNTTASTGKLMFSFIRNYALNNLDVAGPFPATSTISQLLLFLLCDNN